MIPFTPFPPHLPPSSGPPPPFSRLLSPVQVVLGLYIIRGDNIAVVGELDEELDASLDLTAVRAQPLKQIAH